MASSQDSTIDLRYYARLLWRRKWLLLLCTLATLCAAAVTVNVLPRQYQSVATILIQDRRALAREVERMMIAPSGNEQGYRAEEQRIARIVGYVDSRPFLERVVKILRMHEDPAVRAEAARRQANYPELDTDEIAVRILVGNLKSRIRVGSAGPGLYRFVVHDYSPRNAQLLAKWISELFIDMTVEKELDEIRAARNFGAEQLRLYEERLRRSEAALENYAGSLIQQNLATRLVRPDNLTLAEALQDRISDDAVIARARVGAFARTALNTGLPLADPRLLGDPGVEQAQASMENALARLSEEELAMGGSPLAVSNARGAVATARTQFYQQIESRAREIFPDAEMTEVRAVAMYVFADLDATFQESAAGLLASAITAAKQTEQSRPASTIEMERLQNEVNRNRTLLESFQAQLVASDLSQAAETTDLGMNIEIVDPAQYPLEPSWPNPRKILILAGLMGPLLGIGFALLSEMLDPTLRTIEDIQRVAPEPVLGTLPLLNDVITHPSRFRRYWVQVTLVGLVVLTAAFFVARATLLPDLGIVPNPVRAVEPEESLVP